MHNSVASATIIQVAAGSSAGQTLASATEELHHLFQTFRASSPAKAAPADKFWKKLKINVDDFTIAWDKVKHQAAHKDALSAEWWAFIESNSAPDGTPKRSIGILNIKRAALDKVFEHLKPSTCGLSLQNVQLYDRTKFKGSSLNKLARLDAFDRRFWDATKKAAYNARWGSITNAAVKSFGLAAVRKGLLRYPGLVIGAFYLGQGDVASAMSQSMGVPRETAQALLDAGIDGISWGLPPPTGGRQHYFFDNGTEIVLGDYFPLMVFDRQTLIVETVMDGETAISLYGRDCRMVRSRLP